MNIARLGLFAILSSAAALFAQPQSVEIGAGAPTEAIRMRFVEAYYRGGFSALVYFPNEQVRSLGAGLYQEFPDAARTANVRYALIKADQRSETPPDGAIDIFQVHSDIYSYYKALGGSSGSPAASVNTVGYPIADYGRFSAALGNAGTYQLFSRNYALFSYSQELLDGRNFYIRDPFFTKWVAIGGIAVLGPPTTGEQAVTSLNGTAATGQQYQSGAVYSFTSGTLNGRVIGVSGSVYALYFEHAGPNGFLGLPVSDEVVLPSGLRRQSFEGGAIEYALGSPPVVRQAVGSISIAPLSVQLKTGETATISARLFSPGGIELTDRTVFWNTSDGLVTAVESIGPVTVRVRALAGGVARITATSEGRTSPPATVLVTSVCCQVGEGAPGSVIRQAFQDVVSRNRLTLALPSPNPVQRVGGGYAQELQAADSGARYLLAMSDRSSAAYFVTGSLLARYLELGGPSGKLGYPVSDPTAGSRQMFENGALAGSPIQLVSGGILAKWGAAGYESGALGPPSGEVAPFLTFAATAGGSQAFRGGLILDAATGPAAGKAFQVSGPILARYLALGGPDGILGMASTDEFGLNGQRVQEFEGGTVEYAPGGAETRVTEKGRQPVVDANPRVVLAGNRIRLAVGGFDPDSTVRVAVSGQPEFEVRTVSGAYVWEAYVPAGAAGGTVAIRAVDAGRPEVAAEGSYTVRSAAETQIRLTKVRGDNQTGTPGALAPLPLRVSLRDEAGNPLAGIPVRFTPSPGASVVSAAAVTNDAGEAETSLRLPAGEGVALATAGAGRQFVTFSVRISQSALAGFPKLTQTVQQAYGNGAATIAQKGSMLASAASILRYYQDRNELPAQRGLADVAALNAFLRTLCIPGTAGTDICDGYITVPGTREQVVNLWRLGLFTGGAIDVRMETPRLETVRDLVSQGWPVLVAVSMQAGDVVSGAHFVVATGVAVDGKVLIHDPNPNLNRATLDEYLAGFIIGSQSWKGALTAAIRLVPQAGSPAGFLIASTGLVAVTSPTGAGGQLLDLPDQIFDPSSASLSPAGRHRLRYLDGAETSYQVELPSASSEAVLTTLSEPGTSLVLAGSRAAAFRLTRAGAAAWSADPQQLTIAAGSVLNAATYSRDISPGTLVAVYGQGLAREGSATVIQVGGLPAPVLYASSYQLNAQISLELPPGNHTLRVQSPYGAAEQLVEIAETAPGIFLLENGRGAVLNQNGTLNSEVNAARRGEIITVFCTGLGSVSPQDGLMWTKSAVTGVLRGAEIQPQFAGLTAGFIGLYQVNLRIPVSAPPGLNVALSLRQSGRGSNTVAITIQ